LLQLRESLLAFSQWQVRNQGSAFGPFSAPKNVKALHSSFDICRKFCRIKMKF